jgi:chromosome segregation ATPase
MAIQLGALRDALIDAGADPAKASTAAEEVAGYDNRLTRLTVMVQVSIAILVMLLGSQAALWNQMGELKGQMGELRGQMGELKGQMTDLKGQMTDLKGQMTDLKGQMTDLKGQMTDLRQQQTAILARLAEIGSHLPH